MARDIVRRLIGGVWTTVEATEGEGGSLPAGGTTGQVLTKASDADGDADWEAGGGSQPVKVISFSFAFDTPDLVLTGVPVYTPAAGEFLWYNGASFLDIPAAWTAADGDPWYHFGTADALTAYDAAFGSGGVLNSANIPVGDHAHQVGVNYGEAGSIVFDDATPITLMVDDNSGGDPGLLSGTATLVLVIGVLP